MTPSLPRGLVVNLVTPLTEAARPDRQAFTTLIQRLKDRASAVLVGSLSVGEGLHFSLPDRLELLATALSAGRDAPPVLFEVTGRTEEETVGLLEAAEGFLTAGEPSPPVGYLLTCLVYHSNRHLPRHLAELGRLTARPLVLGNHPDLVRHVSKAVKHKNIRTSVLKKIAANPQVAGLEFHGDISRAVHYQRALVGRPDFRFYDGDEAHFLDQPSSSGLISCGANLAVQAWMDIVHSSLDIAEGVQMVPGRLSEIWRKARLVRQLLSIYQDKPAAFLKAALAMTGVIPSARTADPGEALSEEETGALEMELRACQFI
jgi:dihydrodipicolinate synthase/N-acetylneuraminate lyase